MNSNKKELDTSLPPSYEKASAPPFSSLSLASTSLTLSSQSPRSSVQHLVHEFVSDIYRYHLVTSSSSSSYANLEEKRLDSKSSSDIFKAIGEMSRIDIVLDDSGSMKFPLNGFERNDGTSGASRKSFAESVFRYILGVSRAVRGPGKGVGVYPLNGNYGSDNVLYADMFLLNYQLQSSTPLNRVLENLEKSYRNLPKMEKVKLILLTDGAPTDKNGQETMDELKRSIKLLKKITAKKPIYVTVVACTDKPDVLTKLNKFDKISKKVDVIAPFHIEHSEVIRNEDNPYFTLIAYATKMLAAPYLQTYDRLDEMAVDGNKQKSGIFSCFCASDSD